MTHLLLHDSSTIKFLCPDVMGSFTGRRINIGARTLDEKECICPALVNTYRTV
jgi:hypothetical protein